MRNLAASHLSPWLLPAFFLSGAAGLVYEVLWVRLFGNAFGNTVYSASVVTAVFMLGVGTGGLLVGRWADRLQARGSVDPVRVYVLFEGLIALLAGGVTWLLPHLDTLSASVSEYTVSAEGWYVLTLASHLTRLVVAALLMAPATLLMGGTLTLLIRSGVRTSSDSPGWVVALVYGVNTAGAALGCYLTDALLVPHWGVARTAAVAVAFNLAAALIAALFGRRPSGEIEAAARVEDVCPHESGKARASTAPRVRWLASSVFVTGVAAMGLEIVWFRFLSSVYGQQRIVFSTVLAALLAAMWVGSSLAGVVIRHVRRTDLVLLGTQTGFVASAIGLTALFAVLRTSSSLNLPLVLATCAVVGVPAVFQGFMYPLANTVVQRDARSVGGRAGALYLANTVGNVLGSLAAGFFLLPTLGVHLAILNLAAAGGLGLAATTLAFDPSDRWRRDGSFRRTVAAVVATMAVTFGGFALAPGELVFRACFPRELAGRDVVDSGEGVYEALLVVRTPAGALELWTNGHRMSGTGWMAQRYMRAMAHVPLLLADHPRRVLVICFGVGNTLHAASLHQTVEELEVVDLSRAVLSRAAIFEDSNRGVLNDPRVRVFVNDGRHHLLMRPEGSFDLVTLEPPPITFAGMSSLYSREFYELVRSRLAAGGFLSQWLPAYQVSAETTLGMVRAFVDVFPHAVMLVGQAQDLVLVGRADEPFELDSQQMAMRLGSAPEPRSDLERLALGTFAEFAGMFAAASSTLAEVSRQAQPVTDDRPLNEYPIRSTRQTLLPAELFDVTRIAEWCPTCVGESETAENLRRYLGVTGRLYQSSQYLGTPRGPLPLPPLGFEPPASDPTTIATIASSRFLVLTFASTPALVRRANAERQRGDLGEAARLLRRARDIDPWDVEVRLALAETLASLGRTSAAEAAGGHRGRARDSG